MEIRDTIVKINLLAQETARGEQGRTWDNFDSVARTLLLQDFAKFDHPNIGPMVDSVLFQLRRRAEMTVWADGDFTTYGWYVSDMVMDIQRQCVYENPIQKRKNQPPPDNHFGLFLGFILLVPLILVLVAILVLIS